jgi:hypothetical protein
MTREQKLVARLETHEKAVEETKAKLLEAQRGFLQRLGGCVIVPLRTRSAGSIQQMATRSVRILTTL